MKNERRVMFRGALMLGLMAACAAPQGASADPLRDQMGPYEVEVLADGLPLPTFHHRGESYVMGNRGQRYVLRVHNRSPRRVEAVVTVDGLDVIDGQTGDFTKRGYLVPAWGSVDIDGWRLSNQQAAAFRFSAVGASYAGLKGQARNVGVIGVAVFPEREVRRPPVYVPHRRAPWYERSRSEDLQAPSASGRASGAPAAPAEGVAQAESAPYDDVGAVAPRRESKSRPGLGTEFGEAVDSSVHEVSFVRANPHRPSTVVGVRYNDRRGLVAMGIDVDGDRAWSDADLRRTASPFPASGGFARPPRGWNGY